MAEIITIPDNSIIYDINIDMHQQGHWDDVYTKQYDTNSRYIRCTVWNNGNTYPISSDKIITFSCTKPKTGYGIDNIAGIDTEGRIIYLISDQTSIEDGNFKAEFRIYSTMVVGGATVSKRETTYDFKMHVAKSALDDTAVISAPEFNVLTNLISTIGDLINDVNVLMPDLNQALIDEGNRVIAENGRVDAEEVRAQKDLTRPDYIYLTQVEYDALPLEEKEDINKIYEITDDDGELPTELEALIADTEAAAIAAWAAAGASLPDVGTAGTYTKVTTDSKGRVSSGSNPINIGDLGITNVYTKTEADTKTGDLSTLTTTDKTSLVGAINEIDSELAEIASISQYGIISDGVTDQTAEIIDLFTALGDNFKGTLLIPYNTLFDIMSVYGAMPVGVNVFDKSLINQNYAVGNRTKPIVFGSRDTDSDDSHYQIVSGHHAILLMNNLGIAKKTDGTPTDSASKGKISRCFAGGFLTNGTKGPRLFAMETFSKLPSVNKWAISLNQIRKLSEPDGAEIGDTIEVITEDGYLGIGVVPAYNLHVRNKTSNTSLTTIIKAENTNNSSVSGINLSNKKADGTVMERKINHSNTGILQIRKLDDSGSNLDITDTYINPKVTLGIGNTSRVWGSAVDGDTTPSISGVGGLVIANTVATTITNFDGELAGENPEITLIFTSANTTIQNGTIRLKDHVNWTPTVNSTLTLFKNGALSTAWFEKCRSQY